MYSNNTSKVDDKPCKLTNLNNLLLNQRFERSLIAKGSVLKLLRNNNKAYSEMEMSIILDISVWLIRAELKSLLNSPSFNRLPLIWLIIKEIDCMAGILYFLRPLDSEPIEFKQKPLKLVTEYIDGKLNQFYELPSIVYWHLSHKELTISLTEENIAEGGKNA